MKVFLGGTIEGDDWRKTITPMLKCDVFDPYIREGEWNAQAKKREEHEKKTCDIFLCVITNGIRGVYSIAEATEIACQPGKPKVIFCNIYKSDGSKNGDMMKSSLRATEELLTRHKVPVYNTLEEVVEFLNKANNIMRKE